MVRERTDLQRAREVLRVFERALEVPALEREEWLADRCGDDQDLADSVRRLVERESSAGSLGVLGAPALARMLAEGAAPELRPGTHIGGFELVRLVGQGGMGRVYEAREKHPERRVALKVLRADLDSESMRQRFRWEADALARLDHPGIARILATGVHVEETDLGQRRTPWLALDFVDEARDLFAYAREQGLSLAQRVDLFVRVCRAVHHGHLRGVLHRDLKASNILVRVDGSPVVIDFGVARALDPDPEHATGSTRAGDLVGTLATMSPEQVERDPRELDLRSDVYSLGAVLYELLGGRPPHDLGGRSVVEAARIVVERDPEPLEDLPRDLWAIVSTALAKERAQRFESAAEMADDLERFLSGEPVRAAAPGSLRRAVLFVRRHRLPVALAAGIAVVLIAGLGATWRQWRRALAAEHTEREQRVLAERRFEDVRALAHTFIVELDDDLAAVPGNTRARERIVETGLVYLERLARDRGDDPVLASELVEAWTAIGDVQGSYTTASLGRRADARASYERAVELGREFCAQDRSARHIEGLARALGRIGDLEQHGGRTEDAARWYDESLDLALEIDQPPEDLVEVLYGLDGRRSDDALARGALGDALELAEQKFVRLEGVRARHPESLYLRREVAAARGKRGRILMRIGSLEQAEADFRAAEELLVAVEQAAPATPETRTALAFNAFQYGQFLAFQERLDEAEEQIERALEHQTLLCDADPDDAYARRHLLVGLNQLAEIYVRGERHRLARPLVARAVQLARDLHEQGADLQSRRDLHLALGLAALNLSQSGQREDSAALFAEVISMAEGLLRDFPHDANLRRNLYADLRNLAEVHRDWAKEAGTDQHAHWIAARDAYIRAIEVLEKMRAAGTLTHFERGAMEQLEGFIAECEARL